MCTSQYRVLYFYYSWWNLIQQKNYLSWVCPLGLSESLHTLCNVAEGMYGGIM